MEINLVDENVGLEDPYLVEGFPGVGLVAKIAADYIVQRLDMQLYAEVFSEDAPSVTVFEKGELQSSIRIYASEEHDLLVLKSDAPVSSEDTDIMEGLNEWMEENGITPLYQLGIPVQKKQEEPEVRGVFSGDASEVIDKADIQRPQGFGIVSGPTGGLLEKAIMRDLNAVGLTVKSDPQFPDPDAARKLIEEGISQITGISIDTANLKQSAEEIKEKKQKLVKQMQEAEDHEKSQAYPSEMYV